MEKKKRKNSREKGNRAEREVAKIFSTWCGIPNAFGRTPGSGSFATRLRKYGKQEDDFRGDLFGPPNSTLHVESKREEAWTMEGILTGNSAIFEGWWAQTIRDCPDGKTPLLVFRRNSKPWFVCLLASDFYKYVGNAASGVLPSVIVLAGGDRLVTPLLPFLSILQPAYFGLVSVSNVNHA